MRKYTTFKSLDPARSALALKCTTPEIQAHLSLILILILSKYGENEGLMEEIKEKLINEENIEIFRFFGEIFTAGFE